MSTLDPTGPEKGRCRVIRGGSWNYCGKSCRSAFRFWLDPGNRNDDLGFRVAAQASEGFMPDTTDPFLCALRADPDDTLGWLALADSLEEEGQDDRAELLRLVTYLRLNPTAEDHPSVQARMQDLLSRGVTPHAITCTNSIGLELTLIPPGVFWMGSSEDEEGRYNDEGPRHLVGISSFLMGTFPVTREQYLKVMGTQSVTFQPAADAARHPVVSISWHEAVAFCAKLTELEKDTTGLTYQLPTEAQWEYACRAGTTTPFAFGESLSSTQANFNGEYPYGGAAKGPNLQGTCAVGSYKPNAFGLYDMHGNVWEWCQDWYSEDTYRLRVQEAKRIEKEERAALKAARKVVARDPGGAEGEGRVTRGGEMECSGGNLRSGNRMFDAPDTAWRDTGFRIAAVNPVDSGAGSGQILRGGYWGFVGNACRSGYRFGDLPGVREDGNGFRVVAIDPAGASEGQYQVFRGGCLFSRETICRAARRSGDLSSRRMLNLGFRIRATLPSPAGAVA